MRPLVAIAAVLGFVSTTFAAPASLSLDLKALKLKIKIKQVPHGKVFINGPLSMLATFNKYAKLGAVAPADVIAAAQDASTQQGSVTATPQQYDEIYLCPVTVGNNNLMLSFDTGSADLWAFSNLTPKKQAKGHTVYDTSSGTKLDGYTWKIKYGDGSGAKGLVYSDKVVVGSVTATSQAVEAATSVSSSFAANVESDGVVGLAFSKVNTVQPVPQNTFFDTVKPTLSQQLFTADLKKGAPGQYTFGYIDDTAYTGNITYIPVNTANGLWQFTAGGYSLGNDSTSGSIGSAIADTGTTLMYLPSKIAKAYYATVPGAQYNTTQAGYTLPCDATPPDFNVEIGGTIFTVPGSYIIYAPLTSGGTSCFGSIQSNKGIGLNIFGDVFLKSVYAVFDSTQDSPRLGFAAQS